MLFMGFAQGLLLGISHLAGATQKCGPQCTNDSQAQTVSNLPKATELESNKRNISGASEF